MNYQAIRTLVAADQALSALAGANAEAAKAKPFENWATIAAALNAKDQTRQDGATRDVLQNALMQIPYDGDTLWFKLRAIRKNEAHPMFQLADKIIHVALETEIKGVNFSNPGIVAMMDTLQAVGMLTAEQKASINALGTVSVSRAELAGLPNLQPQDVLNAMLEVI